MQVSNWGKYPIIEAQVESYRESRTFSDHDERSWIARGMGRCYGDASLGDRMISCLHRNRFLAFDVTTGILKCESGVTFADLLDVLLPKGWFPPVTPGTKFVSMGGAIASDVHGKNHHVEGSFCRHVRQLELLLPDGRQLICSRTEKPDLFEATCGGMGLTGLILNVTLQMKAVETAWIDMESIKAANLSEIISLIGEFRNATYSMAWLDTTASGKRLGRSILMKGEHARPDQLTRNPDTPLEIPSKRKFNVPFDFPSFVLNPLSVKAFNTLYYSKQFKKRVQSITDYDSFFYPLDSIHNWNRIYGKRGFVQYQFVIPGAVGAKGLEDILTRISDSGFGSFLTVLKYFGEEEGLVSFPMEGYTLAMDFPVSKRLFQFLDELDLVVTDYGGRIYLTKDARMQARLFEDMYPGLSRFREIIRKADPQRKIQSHQSQRLNIHGN